MKSGAAEVGDIEKAYEYFMESAEMDLDDVDHNVKDGVHIASMAGTWISLVYGFAGMRDEEGRLSFRPQLPKKWGRLSFTLMVRGQVLNVSAEQESTTYCLRQGTELAIEHQGRRILLEIETPITVR